VIPRKPSPGALLPAAAAGGGGPYTSPRFCACHSHHLTDVTVTRRWGREMLVLCANEGGLYPHHKWFLCQVGLCRPGPNPPRAREAKLDPWGEILQHRGWWQVVAERPHGATMGHCSWPHLGCLQHPGIYEAQPQPWARLLQADWGGAPREAQRGRGRC
jgi:hypothetical protein